LFKLNSKRDTKPKVTPPNELNTQCKLTLKRIVSYSLQQILKIRNLPNFSIRIIQTAADIFLNLISIVSEALRFFWTLNRVWLQINQMYLLLLKGSECETVVSPRMSHITFNSKSSSTTGNYVSTTLLELQNLNVTAAEDRSLPLF
jgi:hypothetical protein